MARASFLLLALVPLLLSCHKEEHHPVYPSEAFTAAIQTADGGFVLGGNRFFEGSAPDERSDLYLVRIDNLGTLMWERSLDGVNCGAQLAMTLSTDSVITVAGFTVSANGIDCRDPFVATFDLSGNFIIRQTVSGVFGSSSKVISRQDGGFAFAGVDNLGTIHFLRTGSSGISLASREYATGGACHWDVFKDIVECRDHEFLLVSDSRLLRITENGDSLWSKAVDSLDHPFITALAADADSGFTILGSLGNYPEMSTTPLIVVKTDSLGDSLWTRRFSGAGIEYFWTLAHTSDGGYIAGGEFGRATYQSEDLYLMRLDELANLRWTSCYGQTQHESCFNVLQTRDDGFLLLGFTEVHHNGGGDDAIAVRVAPSGNMLWQHTYGQ